MPGVIADAPAAKAPKPTKNQQRRAKEKLKKREVSATPSVAATPEPVDANPAATTNPQDADANHPLQPIEPSTADPIQDVPDVEDVELPVDDPLYTQFQDIIERFKAGNKKDDTPAEPEKPEVFHDDDNIQGEDEEEQTEKKLSKKARKAANKLSVAELKAIVRKPEIVEWNDTSSSDPRLLVAIKSSRNVVPVPSHWSLKREYLSSKRGIEKPGFALPKFIAETGISEMRDAVLEKQADATLKQRQRERVAPKMGKLDIDYTKLYEAFFRRQTKPELTRYGEVYYEGKEYETNLRHLRPGELSDELKEALNIPPGAPPPWLINQQRVGPPPSYPALKIDGLNAPPPPGGQWGFHPGGYGKPPLDEHQRPLFGGDIFGVGEAKAAPPAGEPVEKTIWGELAAFEEEEEGEEEEEEDGDEEDGTEEDIGTGMQTPSGTETPGGIYSTAPSEFGTQSMAGEFDLRKQRRGTETEESVHRSAGQVIGERSIKAEGFFGGDRAYDLSATRQRPDVPVLGSEQANGRKRKVGDVDVSIDADALERDDRLTKEELQKKYEGSRQQQGGWQGGVVDQEDLSDMITEERVKRQKMEQREQKKREERRRGR